MTLIFVRSRRSVCTAIYPLGACVLSVVWRWEVIHLLDVDFYAKINQGVVFVCC